MKTKKSFPAKIIKIVFVITLLLLIAISSAQESAQEKSAGEDAFEEETATEEADGEVNPEEETATEEAAGEVNPEEETATEEAAGEANPEEETENSDEKPTIWQSLAPYAALLFGTIALLIEFSLAKEKNWTDKIVYGWDPDDIIRFLGLTVIITLAVFLGLAGMSMDSEIFTAIIGFLAAVAGYLAGNIRQGVTPPGTQPQQYGTSEDKLTDLERTVDGRYTRGIAFYNKNKYQESVNEFVEAIKIDQNNADAWYYKGLALEALNDKNGAATAFQKAKDLGYSEAEVTKALARVREENVG
jgi:tetratricopeptide (TPR) repeat protein